jgi:hypothetical protein
VFVLTLMFIRLCLLPVWPFSTTVIAYEDPEIVHFLVLYNILLLGRWSMRPINKWTPAVAPQNLTMLPPIDISQ